MRRLLTKARESYFSTFQSSNLVALVNRKIKQAQTLQQNKYGQVSKIFFDLYMKDLLEKENISKLEDRSNNYCFMEADPVGKILKEFMEQSSYYSERHLVTVFEQLKNAVNISRQDNVSSFIKDTNKLFYEPRFDHLIQQFKFAMRDDVYLSWPGMLKILKCCVELGYIDDDILLLLMRKIQKKLGVFVQTEENKLKYYQIEKNTYYARGLYDAFEKISNNQVFNANIDTIKQRVLNRKRVQKIAERQAKIQDPQIQKIVDDLLMTIKNLNFNVQSFTEAIVAIRSQYRKLTKISGDQKVYRNYLLNTSLMDLEDQLLNFGFIDMEDIRNPQNTQKEAQKVMLILQQQLKKKNIPAIQAFIGEEDIKNMKEQEIKQFKELSQAYLVLAQIANMPCMIIKSKDGRTMISEKWQRQLMNQKIYKDTWVYADRMFRKVYKQSVLFTRKDIQQMRNRIANVPVQFSLQYINSLCNLGLHEQAQYIIHEQIDRINKFDFSNLQSDTLFKLVGVMNNLSHINSWNSQFLSKLNEKLNEYLKNYSLMKPYEKFAFQQFDTLADTLKFYAIHGRQHLIEKQKLYEVAIAYKSFVQNYEGNPFFYRKYVQGVRLLSVDENLTQAENRKFHLKHIQSIEKAKKCQQLIAAHHEGQTIPIFDNRNPFSESFQKLCLQFSHGQKVPQIPYFTTGIDNNQMTGAMLAKDTDCSLGGRHCGSGLRAYLARVSKTTQSIIQPIGISRFLDIDYNENKIQAKQVKPIEQQLRSIFNLQSDKIRRFAQGITLAVWDYFFDDSGPKKSKYFDQIQMKRIVYILNNVLSEHYQNKKSLSKNHHALKQAKIAVLLLNLKRQLKDVNSVVYNVLNENQKEPIQEQLDTLIKQISKDIPESLLNSAKNQNEQSFVGKRLTIQTTQVQNSIIEFNCNKQLLDSIYFNDSRYVQYEDWQQLFKSKALYKKFNLHEVNSTVRLLSKVFLPQVKQSIEIIPFSKQQILETPYPFHWQKLYTRRLSEKEGKEIQQLKNIAENQPIQPFSKKQRHTLTMQNYKHQLKLTKKPHQIVKYVLDFDFIQQLIIQTNNNERKSKLNSSNFLNRNYKKYFEYLERKYEKIYFESPYMQYILSKISPTQEIKELLQQRANARVKGQSLYQLGEISKQDYYNAVKVVQDKIIKKLEAIKHKSLDYTSNTIHEGGLKMVQLQKNIQEFSRLFQRANIYKIQTDPDIHGQKLSYSDAFEIKRSKAEHNLIKFHLIQKSASGTKLNSQQQKYLQNWKKFIKEGKKPDRKFTNRKISDVSQNDKQRLKLQLIDLNSCGEIALNELIIELNHFLDERVIEEVQRNMSIGQLTKGVQIPKQLFEFTSNKQYVSQSLRKQKQIFEANAKLNQQDIGHLIQLVSILKVQSPFMRKKFNDIYKQFKTTIETMNQFECRKELISQYCEKLEIQYHQNYRVEYNRDKKMEEAQGLWDSIFTRNYPSEKIENQKQLKKVTTEEISKFVEKLSSRLFVLKKNVPPFFGQLVLNILKHPQTSPLTKQTLLARLQLFKIPIVIDSEDIASLCNYIGKKQQNQQIDTMELLPKLAQQNFSQSISNKMMNL